MSDPANRLTNPAGGKYYMHPLTGEKFDSVTTVLDLVDKAALKQWAANLSADFVIEHMPQFLAAQITPECGNTNNRCHLKHGRDGKCERCPCGRCLPCWRRRAAYRHSYESSRRSEEGTECHQAIHFWIASGGDTPSLRPEVRPYFDSFLTWVAEHKLQPNGQPGQGDWEQLEITLLNRQYMYAGTSDGALWIHRGRTALADRIVDRIGGPNAEKVLVRVDYKTREKPDERLYHDMPWQGVAYERCPVAMLPDGREFTPPSTHARAVLQLRPADACAKAGTPCYSFKLMHTDDTTFQAFLGVLEAYRWVTGPGKTAFDAEVWAAIPPGVLGEPELSDPWAQAEVIAGPWPELSEPTAGRPKPFVAPSSDLSTEAEVVHLPEFTPQEAPESIPDPFKAHNNPAQVKADLGRPTKRTPRKAAKKTAPAGTSATLASIDNFDPGKPVLSALDEPIPF